MMMSDSDPFPTSDGNSDAAPRLHIDSDWKAQAQAEKERLAKKEAERSEGGRRRGSNDLPPADFRTMIGVFASQAVMSLGGYGDPESGRVVVDLAAGQFAIDMLALLEEKTKGNLSDEEADELSRVLRELRGQFVHIATLIAQQRGGAAAGAPETPAPSKPIIEMP